MDFLFDLSALPTFSNPFGVTWYLIANGGWILIILTCIWGGWEGWKEYIRNKFDATVDFVILAIDVPKGNEQSPKAVEHIFSHFYGMKTKGNLKDRFLKGYTQLGISLEIVSIEGYIQFLIRTPRKFRDLVEAAIYAQYPEAEITEVEDYVDMIPKPLEFPHSEYDLWGTELKLMKSYLYPIRTYPEFEHSLTQRFMDPMASILEIMSRIGPGEHIWLQFVIAPVDQKWRNQGTALIRRLIGKKEEKKGSDLTYFPREIGKGLTESFTASLIPPSEMENAKFKQQERQWPSMMQHLSPDEREVIEAIGMKIAKLGFMTKIRLIYAAPKNKFEPSKGVSGVIGSLQQFSTQNVNAIAVNKKTRTKIDYFFIKTRILARKRRILWAYRYRSMKRGRRGFIFNTEELATLWHFPDIEVKVPAVQSVDAKKSQPPIGLPLETAVSPLKKEANIQKGSAPTNLPTI